MLKLFNTLGKKIGEFNPPAGKVVTIFTCGPSIYQKAHIGNFRTFLFEDVLVRYLRFQGYKVLRGMNFTDIEEKAISEAKQQNRDLKKLTGENIAGFLEEMRILKMAIPEYLPKASDYVDEAVDIIKRLVELGIAYRYKNNIYFDPLKVTGFGRLYGLDMAKWPRQKKRFHKDTYSGIQWNLGDFVLWHGEAKGGSASWDTAIGRGRPAWNIQDPAMIMPHYHETLSIYCGGIDNLYRHHDYTLAILDSIRDYPLAEFWLHCEHLFVNGQKMSKSKGNVYYIDTLLGQGYTAQEVRFFLIYGHYRRKLDFSPPSMIKSTAKLRELKKVVEILKIKAGGRSSPADRYYRELREIFSEKMDDDLHLDAAVDVLQSRLSGLDFAELKAEEAAGLIKACEEIDDVLQVLF